MPNFAVVNNGTVVNIIVKDVVSAWAAPAECTAVLIGEAVAGIGYLYDATNGFTAPPVTYPAPTQPVTQ